MKRRTYLKIAFVLGVTTASSSLSSCIHDGKGLSPEEQESLLASLADTILPDTDVPGALRAGVPAYITALLATVFTARERDWFIRGLQKIQDHSHTRYHLPFEHCRENDRLDILQYFESKALYRIEILNKIRRRVFGEPFIKQLKRLVVNGYCTSRLGATEGLVYDPIPIGYETCTPLSNQPRTWATE